MQLGSENFRQGKFIPIACTRDGDNISPQLSWDDVPNGARSFAIFCEDPDAPAQTWHHWAIYDLPSTLRTLPQAMAKDLSGGAQQGLNDFGNVGYDGPSPARHSKPHRYCFRLLALNADRLPISRGQACRDIERLARQHTVGEALLIGLYGDADKSTGTGDEAVGGSIP